METATALFENTPNGVTELAQTGGGSYLLGSIELAKLNGPSVVNVTFAGNLTGGGTVTQTFTLAGLPGAETFTFTGFNRVS